MLRLVTMLTCIIVLTVSDTIVVLARVIIVVFKCRRILWDARSEMREKEHLVLRHGVLSLLGSI